MNEKNLEKKIQHSVLEKIRGGKIRVHSRAHFIVHLTITIFLTLLALILSALVISFVFFSVHESGEQFLLGFGGSGILTFLLLFPWGFLLLDIIILLLLEWFLQSFKLVYRVSLLTVFLGVFVLSAFLGLIINLTPLHVTLLQEADKGVLPIIDEIYESIRDSHQDKGVFRGTITSVLENEITITHDDNDHDADDGTWNVILPPNYPSLKIGDRVYVFGLATSSVIQARGIKILSTGQ
jgi:hypothetical protein